MRGSSESWRCQGKFSAIVAMSFLSAKMSRAQLCTVSSASKQSYHPNWQIAPNQSNIWPSLFTFWDLWSPKWILICKKDFKTSRYVMGIVFFFRFGLVLDIALLVSKYLNHKRNPHYGKLSTSCLVNVLITSNSRTYNTQCLVTGCPNSSLYVLNSSCDLNVEVWVN